MNNKPKALFITHDISNYGASRSLQGFLRKYQGEIDLVIRKRINVASQNDNDIRRKFGAHIRNIYWVFLPFDPCYKAKPNCSLRFYLESLIIELLWLYDRKKLMKIIDQGCYDFIHLNSLVLHPVVSPDYPFIIHVREIFDGCNPLVFENIQNARGVIFIDDATKRPFANFLPRNCIILNNPFDMTEVKNYKYDPALFPDLELNKTVIFSMIGVISEAKGSGFIISTFIRLKEDNVRLLIVGRGDKDYENKCRKLAAGDARILFCGEEQDIQKIYAMSDYVLRGDEYQCVGRTIYEGLYAGCHVVIPGAENQQDLMFQYNTFKDSIHFYHPRSESDLLVILSGLSSRKVIDRAYRSNVDEYICRFHSFVKHCL